MGRLLTALVHAAVMSGRLPAPLINAAFSGSRFAVRGLGRVAGGTHLPELANSIEAVRLFAVSRFDAGGLAECDERFASFGSGSPKTLSFQEALFDGLWALEGLGYRYARRALVAKPDPAALFDVVARLPRQRQGIFQVGVTVAFAEDRLGKIASSDPKAAVAEYLDVCTANSSTMLRGIEAESLGFVALTLFPRFLREAAEAVTSYDPSLDAYFRHGVGRGLYLNNQPALGGSGRTWPALRSTLDPSVGKSDPTDVLEGYGWALGLINLREPSVIRARTETFAVSSREKEYLLRGVREAFLCWLHWKAWDGRLDLLSDFAAVGDSQRGDWCELAATLLESQSGADIHSYGAKLCPRL